MSAFNTPLHGGNPYGGMETNPVQALSLMYGIQNAQHDRALRQALGQSLMQERQQKVAQERTAQAKALFQQEIESASGLKPGEQAEAMPFFGEAQRMTQPGAELQPSTTQLPSGNLLRQPVTGSQQRMEAFGRGAAGLQRAVGAAGEALPPSAEAETVRGQIARGELRVPSAVPGAYEKAIKTAQEAQKLEQSRLEQGAVVSEKQSAAALKAQEAELKRQENIYYAPIKEAELAEKSAQTAKAGVEARKVAGEIGERPLIPGSPQALKAEESRADLETKRLAAMKARQEYADHQNYLAAVQRYRQTGDIKDLNNAILSSTNGAVGLSTALEKGREFDVKTSEFLIAQSGKLMISKQALQEHVNKKGDLPTAENYARDINNINLQMATIGGSPNVSWESVRMEEGAFGKLVRDSITMSREEALALSNDMVQPTSPQGLVTLLKAHSGDLVNRAASGDPAAYQKLIQAASSYPGVTREASDAVVGMLQNKLSQMGPGQVPEIREESSQGIIRKVPPAPKGVVPGGVGQLRFPKLSPAEKTVEP